MDIGVRQSPKEKPKWLWGPKIQGVGGVGYEDVTLPFENSL